MSALLSRELLAGPKQSMVFFSWLLVSGNSLVSGLPDSSGFLLILRVDYRMPISTRGWVWQRMRVAVAEG